MSFAPGWPGTNTKTRQMEEMMGNNITRDKEAEILMAEAEEKPELPKPAGKPIKTRPMLYACILAPLQEIAKGHGYNLVIHGSMNRDMDLVCISWVDNPSPMITVVKEFDMYLRGVCYAEDSEESGYLHSVLPGGRNNYVISLNRGAKWNNYVDEQYYLDISFTPQIKPE